MTLLQVITITAEIII